MSVFTWWIDVSEATHTLLPSTLSPHPHSATTSNVRMWPAVNVVHLHLVLFAWYVSSLNTHVRIWELQASWTVGLNWCIWNTNMLHCLLKVRFLATFALNSNLTMPTICSSSDIIISSQQSRAFPLKVVCLCRSNDTATTTLVLAVNTGISTLRLPVLLVCTATMHPPGTPAVAAV